VPGQDVAASIVADLAAQLLATGSRISELDARITTTFRAHPQAEIIESLSRHWPDSGCELIAAAGDLNGYENAGRLASAAGLVPVPRDSGRRTGNLHRPMRYSRKLRRVFYLSASAAMMREGPNRDYYLKKRGQGIGQFKHSSRWLDVASTSSGPCYAIIGSSNSPRQSLKLRDKVTENPPTDLRVDAQ
jgi:transposase